jgi:nucleotide-binding universal stress UspA family protein
MQATRRNLLLDSAGWQKETTMSIVIAALDISAAARPVLETAVRIGQLTGSDVEAVHVSGSGPEPIERLELLAARNEASFRLLHGPVESEILAALDAPTVLVAVIGSRATPGGRQPVGQTARYILEHTAKPVVVVPPDAIVPSSFQRILVPLEGTEASSRPVLQWLLPLLAADVELVVLHVFTDATRPRMLDHPGRDVELLGREFLARHCPRASGIELRPGPVPRRVVEASEERGSDLIVLSWSQDSSAGRASVIQAVLGASSVPVLLLPVTRNAVPVEAEGRPPGTG